MMLFFVLEFKFFVLRFFAFKYLYTFVWRALSAESELLLACAISKDVILVLTSDAMVMMKTSLCSDDKFNCTSDYGIYLIQSKSIEYITKNY